MAGGTQNECVEDKPKVCEILVVEVRVNTCKHCSSDAMLDKIIMV